MEYLSTLDAGFLEAEDTDPHVSLAVAALAVLGGSMPEFGTFVAGLGERLVEIPRFKQVLRAHTLDLGAPAWVDEVEEPDPVQRLRAVHSRLTKAKLSGQGQAGSLVVSAVNKIPFAVTAWAMRALTRLPQRAVVTVATNAPGPRRRLRVMGQPVLRLLPIVPIALRVRTGVAILSYVDELVFGITADYDAASDVNGLAEGITRAAVRLASLCTRPRPSSARLASDG